VFKREAIMEIWTRQARIDTFVLLTEYKICASSGNPGPKRRERDGQVPEGFYQIVDFNPRSNFYLSLGIDYPNRSDRILGAAGYLGGDIYIHGECVTTGCIPITNDKIKELYLMAVEAKSAGQTRIPVHIFPTRLDEVGMRSLKNDFRDNQNLIDFWTNLKEGFHYFEKHHRSPVVTVGQSGRYAILQ
jgi:murein L,D-transpeptidase YafK